MSKRYAAFAVTAALLTLAFGCKSRVKPARPAASAVASVEASFSASPPSIDSASRFLLIGGGGEPDSSEVQLEADVGLAASVLLGPGTTLFAGGQTRFGVRETSPGGPDETDFRAALGMLFLPRERSSLVRAPRIHVDGASTYENVTRALDSLLATSSEVPLLVLVATHGDQAADPLDGFAVLWGNDALFVRDAVDLLSASSIVRPSRWVVGSCFGGAFARITDVPATATSRADHCGFFATDATRLASGCDPNPERSQQEGYTKQLFTALGRPVEPAADLDGNGRLSLLEAHTLATIRTRSFDVPLSTSEAYARASVAELVLPWEVEPIEALPETVAIIRALGESLGQTSEASAREAFASASQSLGERDEELADLEAARDTAWNRLRVALLERWPWLEDAYAPGWERRVAREAAAIRQVIFHSDVALGYREAEAQAGSVAAEADDLRVVEAMLARLVGAYDLGRMVAVVRRLAPERYARFAALRACEGFEPAVVARPARSE